MSSPTYAKLHKVIMSSEDTRACINSNNLGLYEVTVLPKDTSTCVEGDGFHLDGDGGADTRGGGGACGRLLQHLADGGGLQAVALGHDVVGVPHVLTLIRHQYHLPVPNWTVRHHTTEYESFYGRTLNRQQ